MAGNTVFPAFLKLEHQRDGSAKASFLTELENTLGSAESRFKSFSSEANRQLDAALSVKRNSAGALDLGTAELQRQAAALQQKALAARELATATELASREAGDYSQSARLQLAAVQAAAREAEQAARSARDYAQAQKQLQAVLNRTASSVTAVTGATRGHTIANDNAAASTGTMRFGLMDLGRQLSDVSTMFALGARPMQIFASQSGQIIQSVQMMTGSTSRLAAFLAGPWGIALTTAALVVTPLIGKLFETSDAMDEVKFASSRLGDAQSILGQVLDQTTGKITTQSDALLGLARAQALAGQIAARQQMADARGNLRNEAAFRPHISAGFGGGLSVSRDRDAAGDIASAVLDGSLSTTEAVAGLESLRRSGYATEQQFLETAKAVTDLGVAAEDLRAFEALERMLTGRGTAGDRALLLDPAKPSRARRDALSDEEKALKRATEETQRYIESLEQEIARVGLSAGQLRQLEIEQAKAGAGTEAQRQRLEELNAEREEAISTLARHQAAEKALKAAAEFQSGTIAPLQRELELLGLVGPARERAALTLEEESFKARLLKDGVDDVNAAWEQYLRLHTEIIDGESALERERQEVELLSQELDRLIGAVSGLGGIGGALGGLLGLATGKLSGIGGPIGALLNIPIGTRTDAEGKVIARHIGDELADIFGSKGPFGETMTEALRGAGIGSLAGAAAFGQQGTTGQLGSAIGGSLGQELGEKFLSKGLESIASGLGSAAGPIGSILGGLLGGALGGLLSSTARGSATIGGMGGGLGVAGTGGNNSARIAASSKSANAVIDSLEALAEQLGATIDPSRGRVSIGLREGNYRVDTSGRGVTKTKKGAIDFGEDAEAAAQYAMMDLIRDGVLTGLRAGTQQILQQGQDLQTAVSKALSFEGVFTRLKERKDPLGAVLDTLEKEFSRLRDIFAEANANAEERTQLEELYGLERADIIKRESETLTASLKGLLADLTVNNSALSLRDRRELALAEYSPLAAQVQAGDVTAFDGFADAARTLLDIERQLSGSQTGYFDLLAEVRGLTESALAATGMGRDPNQSVVSAVAQMNADVSDRLEALDYRLAAVNDNLGSLIAQGLVRSEPYAGKLAGGGW